LVYHAFLGVTRDGEPIGVALLNAKNHLLGERHLDVHALVSMEDLERRIMEGDPIGFWALTFERAFAMLYKKCYAPRTTSIHVLVGDPAFRPFSGYVEMVKGRISAEVEGDRVRIHVPSEFYTMEASADSFSVSRQLKRLGEDVEDFQLFAAAKDVFNLVISSLQHTMFPHQKVVEAPLGVHQGHPVMRVAFPTMSQTTATTLSPVYVVRVPIPHGKTMSGQKVIGAEGPGMEERVDRPLHSYTEMTADGECAYLIIPIVPGDRGSTIEIELMYEGG